MAKKIKSDTPEKTVDMVINEVNGMFKGRNPIMRASQMAKKPVMPTGVKELDDGIGGGIPTGVSVLWGGESVGKSTICLQTVANCQRAGKVAMYIDLERKLDLERAQQLGVNLDELLLVTDIEYGEEAFEIIRNMARDNAVDLIVLDSLSALAMHGELYKGKTGAEKDREIAEAEMAMVAQKLSKGIKVFGNYLEKDRYVHLLCVAQLRLSLGSFIVKGSWSGGNAIKHASKLTVGMRRGQKDNAPVRKSKVINPETGRLNTVEETVGFESVLKVEKNHCSSTNRLNEGSEIHVPFYFETGFVAPDWANEVEMVASETEMPSDSVEVAE